MKFNLFGYQVNIFVDKNYEKIIAQTKEIINNELQGETAIGTSLKIKRIKVLRLPYVSKMLVKSGLCKDFYFSKEEKEYTVGLAWAKEWIEKYFRD